MPDLYYTGPSTGGGGGGVNSVSGTPPIDSSGGANPVISLESSGVTPGAYGDASHVTTFTVDTHGLLSIAAATAIQIAESQVTSLVADLAAKAPLASPTFTGTVTVPTPSNATDASTKGYVDGVASGLSIKASVQEATAAALPANTYNNGASGIGATLTANAAGVLTVDGIAVALNDRVLVKNEVAGANNGIYTVTTLGTGIIPYVLTRSTDMNTAVQIPGAFAFVEQGTVNIGAGFVVASAGPYTIGTTAIVFTQFSGAGEIVAGNGLTKTGNTLATDPAATVQFAALGLGTSDLTHLQSLNVLATQTWSTNDELWAAGIQDNRQATGNITAVSPGNESAAFTVKPTFTVANTKTVDRYSGLTVIGIAGGLGATGTLTNADIFASHFDLGQQSDTTLFRGVSIHQGQLGAGLIVDEVAYDLAAQNQIAAGTTTLNGSITSGATSLVVNSAAGFPASGSYVIQIDQEILRVTAGAGTTTWTVTRGVGGTTAAAHSNAATVSGGAIQRSTLLRGDEAFAGLSALDIWGIRTSAQFKSQHVGFLGVGGATTTTAPRAQFDALYQPGALTTSGQTGFILEDGRTYSGSGTLALGVSTSLQGTVTIPTGLTITNYRMLNGAGSVAGSGTVTNYTGMNVAPSFISATISTLIGVAVAPASLGTITTYIGLSIGSVTGGAGTQWGFQVSNIQSYHQGPLGIGSTSAPTWDVHLSRGNSAQSGVGVKVSTTGPTAPASNDAGVISIYKGTNYFLLITFNDAGTTRYKYLQLNGTGTTWAQGTALPT